MRKFRLENDGNFVEIKVKTKHKSVIKEKISLPAKEGFWSKMARFFYSCFINLKKELSSSLYNVDNSKYVKYKNYWKEEGKYRDYFGI